MKLKLAALQAAPMLLCPYAPIASPPHNSHAPKLKLAIPLMEHPVLVLPLSNATPIMLLSMSAHFGEPQITISILQWCI